MRDILAPQDLRTHRVLDDHQTKASTPVCRIELNDHMLVFGYLLDITHTLERTAYSTMANTILPLKLGNGLLALNIIRYDLILIEATASHKLPSTGLAFIQLFAASKAIPDHI